MLLTENNFFFLLLFSHFVFNVFVIKFSVLITRVQSPTMSSSYTLCFQSKTAYQLNKEREERESKIVCKHKVAMCSLRPFGGIGDVGVGTVCLSRNSAIIVIEYFAIGAYHSISLMPMLVQTFVPSDICELILLFFEFISVNTEHVVWPDS